MTAAETISSHLQVATDPTARIALLSVAAMRVTPRPAWRIKPLILATGLGVIYGASGAGKTFAVLDMVLSIVRGIPWFGHRVKKGRVVYVAAEGSLQMRVEAYMRHHKLTDDDLDGLVIVQQAINLLDEDGDLGALIEAISDAGDGVDVVVIDTLNRAMAGGDENGSQDMGKMVDAAKQIETAFNCTVLYVHHSGKNEAMGGRGHSSLKGASDTEISIKGGEGPRIICAEKVREGESGIDVGAFNLVQVDLGATRDHDPDADESERDWSCVVSPCELPDKKGPKLSDAARAALDCFHQMMNVSKETPPIEVRKKAGRNAYKSGQTACHFDDWRESCIASGRMSASDKKNTINVAFKRAMESLIKAKKLVVCDGWVWGE
jgi:KaiC/GvpD/RAD55 family RecA-like ATPase